MYRIVFRILIAATCLLAVTTVRVARAQFGPKDYLSEEESEKIRDADTPAKRIKLYLAFADDRLKKFDYELNRSTPERRRNETLNSLLNGYAGCVDDGADQLAVAREKQLDIRASLKQMRSMYTDFLDRLQSYAKNGKDLETYKDTLEDAIDATKDALTSVDEAEKEMLPAPVRRKPS